MKNFRLCLTVVLLIVSSLSAWSAGLPAKVEAAFKKMYPEATHVEWEQIGCYYAAAFILDNQETDVWINDNGEWAMTTRDVESLEKIPTPAAEAFMKSIMASMRLRDVRIVTFPNHPTVILIEVEGYNSDEEFQLLYSPKGKLLKSLNVSQMGGEIYPELFE